MKGKGKNKRAQQRAIHAKYAKSSGNSFWLDKKTLPPKQERRLRLKEGGSFIPLGRIEKCFVCESKNIQYVDKDDDGLFLCEACNNLKTNYNKENMVKIQ